MKIIYFILGGFFLICLLTASASLADLNKAENNNSLSNKTTLKPVEDSISILPSKNIKQGDTLFIEVKTNKKLSNPYFTYKGKKINLYTKDDKYTGILGIDALEKPDNYKIIFGDDTGNLQNKTSINVASAKYPIQNIVISGGKGGLAPAPGELEKVQAAKTILSPVSYWSSIPFNSPAQGCIISNYGLTRYHNGKPTGDYHKGVDIKAAQGTPIKTITGGKVLIAEQFRLHGGTVAIDHGQGLTSIYIHMSKILVKPGQQIKSGQTIGLVGATGFATGPHLHWGLYANGIPVDPMKSWIKSVAKCS